MKKFTGSRFQAPPGSEAKRHCTFSCALVRVFADCFEGRLGLRVVGPRPVSGGEGTQSGIGHILLERHPLIAAHIERRTALVRDGGYRGVGRGGGGGIRPDPGYQVTMSISRVVCPAVTVTRTGVWSGHGPLGVLRKHWASRV